MLFYETLLIMPRNKKFLGVATNLLLLVILAGLNCTASAQASDIPILGTAGNYQILSGAALTLGASITGLDPTNVSSSTTAVDDLNTAIANLSGATATSVAADLGGKTYTPGSYAALAGTAFTMTSSIVLDGLNDCNSKFYFVTPGAMDTTAGISITLINDAIPSNIYWVSGAAITVGASNHIAGNFLSSAAITVGASTSVNGRLLAKEAVSVGASVAFQGFPLGGCSIPSGVLSISVPTALGEININSGETQIVELGVVVVTDTRASGAPWTVASLCSFVRNGSGDQITGQFFAYSIKDLSSTGGAVLTEHTLNSMLVSAPVLDATVGVVSNGATWTPVITIAVPQDQPAGTYTGVITHSVY